MTRHWGCVVEHVSIMKIIVEQIKHDTISQRVNALVWDPV